MSKYSDHTTVGGQVLAHRIRMMTQNWSIIWIVGRISFLGSFLFYTTFKYRANDIWNYICMVKAVYRDGMSTLPSSLFNNSYLWFKSGRCEKVSDHFIATSKEFLVIKAQIESDLWFGLKLGFLIGLASMVLAVIITKYFGKSLADNKELISGHEYVSVSFSDNISALLCKIFTASGVNSLFPEAFFNASKHTACLILDSNRYFEIFLCNSKKRR